jgi:hypothetical protein
MSKGISNEQPPENTEETLREFLKRRFIDIAIALSQDPKFTERKEMPYKPQTGAVHYFGDPLDHGYDPAITQEGFWGLRSDGWVFLG